MLKLKLNELLKSNNVTINDLSNKTGINRASLTQLANNESKMVKFETLNKLISFFNISNSEISNLFEIDNSGSLYMYGNDVIDDKSFYTKLNINYHPEIGVPTYEKSLILKISISFKEDIAILKIQLEDKLDDEVKNILDKIPLYDVVSFISDFVKDTFGLYVNLKNGTQPLFSSKIQDVFFDKKISNLFVISDDIPIFTNTLKVLTEQHDIDFFPMPFIYDPNYIAHRSKRGVSGLYLQTDLYCMFNSLFKEL